jgi:hypothetical protein
MGFPENELWKKENEEFRNHLTAIKAISSLWLTALQFPTVQEVGSRSVSREAWATVSYKSDDGVYAFATV